ncbi:hypothetical protein, partial [Bacteroides caecimuris]
MKTNYVVCPLSGHSLSKGSRLRRLSNVEEMLASTYGHFFRQVEQPYSCVEQEILTRIIKSLSALLQGDLPRPCFFCKFAKGDLVFWGRVEFFRLELPTENPFSVSLRLCCLRELENKLNCYFVNEGRNKPYSWREKQVIRRIKKRFVHELRNTSKYHLFKGTHVRRQGKRTIVNYLITSIYLFF